jgi:hypothetical protein
VALYSAAVVTGTAALAVSTSLTHSLTGHDVSTYRDSQVASCDAGIGRHGAHSDGGDGASDRVWLDGNSRMKS